MFCCAKFFTVVGALVVACFITRIILMLVDVLIRPGKNIESFKVGNSSWAVVTGATDGIGKAVATELAKKGFNIFLISRNPQKLEKVSEEIKAFGVDTKVFAIDFTSATEDDFNQIEKQVNALSVSILVNNVGMSHDIPTPFEEESPKRCHDIIMLNINTLMNMTRIVLPQMKQRRKGLILNNGSFAALVPTPYLSVYAGSKGFVSAFSQAIGTELESFNITVEHLNTYFVCTSMSKMRHPSFLIPSASNYAKAVVNKIGLSCGSGIPFTSVPFPSHAYASFIIQWFMTPKFWLDYNLNMQKKIRSKALKKQQRIQRETESAKQK